MYSPNKQGYSGSIGVFLGSRDSWWATEILKNNRLPKEDSSPPSITLISKSNATTHFVVHPPDAASIGTS